MLRSLLYVSSLLSLFVFPHLAQAIDIPMNADSAKAVCVALQNPSLGHDEALTIATLPGNQGMIRKMTEFKIAATNESFANALVAAAHNQKVTLPEETIFTFDVVKGEIPILSNLIKQIEDDPQAFQGSIERRIALFSPPGRKMKLQGYLVAGGDGGGYTFGGTDFFLNIAIIDDFTLAKIITTHELYHAVQGAFASARAFTPQASAGPQSSAQKACVNLAQLFANLYEEGTALYVEDVSLLPTSHSVVATRIQADLNDGLKHLHGSATLLELSVTDLASPDALPFDDVYEVGFFGHGVLYNIGYAIAKSIADKEGPDGLVAYLEQPPYKFVLRYTQLLQYGKDRDHPGLGPNTMKALTQLANGCK